MEQLDNILYEKSNYERYKKRIEDLLKNPELSKLGLHKKTLCKTEYGYNLDCLSVGYGKYELFIVAGSHGSEIITTDFVIQLINNLPFIETFDPNLFKINIIPIQNPEGYDISTNTLKSIPDQIFQEKSYEYYLRYRTDSLITKAINELNKFMNKITINKNIITPKETLEELKKFINENPSWKNLSDHKAIPKIDIINKGINNISAPNSFIELQISILTVLKNTTEKLDNKNLNDTFLMLFINQLKSGFDNQEFWDDITNEKQKKLYQQMFETQSINGLQSKKLEIVANQAYKYNPNGSQIIHDSTGTFVNLNANNPLNPGIEAIKNNITIYGPGPKNNIKNYFSGPLGLPTKDSSNFEYTIENKALYQILKESYQKGTYLATILYHGTGGLIYYNPYEPLMEESTYKYFYKYNQELAECYNKSTNYKILENSDTTGYGDLLRRNFPGVLLIELSKMGGNPIAPYGDKNNINITMNDNIKGIKYLLEHFQKQLLNKTKEKSLK